MPITKVPLHYMAQFMVEGKEDLMRAYQPLSVDLNDIYLWVFLPGDTERPILKIREIIKGHVFNIWIVIMCNFN